MKKKIILIDVDGVICEPDLLPQMNKYLGTNYKMNDFTTYYIDDILGDEASKQKFYDSLLDIDLYERVEFMPGAVETIRELSEVLDIHICSSCAMFCMLDRSARFFADKYNFLIRTFPFLDPEKFIFTGVKNLFKADIQIDDKLSHLEGDIGLKLMFTAYHNRDVASETLKKAGAIRVNNWEDVKREIYKYLEENKN